MQERAGAGQVIRAVIIDDEALIRQGFTLILEAVPDIEVVGAADGVSAIDTIEASRPDVVLLDIRMPGVDGLSVLRALRRQRDESNVAMLTTFDSEEHIAEALALGARGFLLKDTDPEHLPQYVRALAAGGMVLAASAGRVVVESALRSSDDPEAQRLVAELSERERAVLRGLAQGRSNSEIGASLHLGVGTVKDHVSVILAKLRVPNRVQAALIAERAGLLRERA